MSIGVENDLQVYGPVLTKQLTQRLLGEITGAFWHDIVERTNHPLSLKFYQNRGGKLPRKPPVIHATDIEPGKIISRESWELTAARVEHVQPYLDSLAYRIDSDEGSILFSGDTRPCEALTSLATNADMLIMECIKTNGKSKWTASASSETDTIGASKTAMDVGVIKLVLSLQAPALDHPTSKAQAIKEVRSEFKEPIVWGEEMFKVPWG